MPDAPHFESTSDLFRHRDSLAYFARKLTRRSLLGTGLGAVLLSHLPPVFVEEAQAAGGPPSLKKMLRIMDDMFRSESSIARTELKVIKPERTRTMRMKMWTRGMDRSLVVIESPARQKGTATLKVENNLWNYLPKISRTVRIPPSMMLNAWMGSDFTNDDLVRDASYEKDFDAAWAGKSTSPQGWILALTAKPKKVGLWKKINLIINQEGTLPIHADYYDRKNRLARTMYFEDVKKVGGRTIPTLMRLVPTDKPRQSTEMRYLSIEFGAKVPMSTFSLSRLERGR